MELIFGLLGLVGVWLAVSVIIVLAALGLVLFAVGLRGVLELFAFVAEQVSAAARARA